MIAKLVFIVLLLAVVLYAWREYRHAPVVGLLSMAAALAGLYFVLVPGHATWLAAWAGIGRGVDLVIYVWVAISLIALLNLHLKGRAQMELITVLARAVALQSATRMQGRPVPGRSARPWATAAGRGAPGKAAASRPSRRGAGTGQ
ncbi:MAG: conserved hypothetical rane protein [Xanthobacteraceae bacterium]|jgi:hypothetical protein|nr:conserved hypothetical rane protein [Xanthobacteraceae bacterium]